MELKAPERVTWTTSGFCPGCGHGIAFRLISEVMEEMGLSDKLLLTVDVACCSLAIECVRFDTIMCAHGRGIASAIGAKKVRPENAVAAYLGDGAAYSIGMAETMHAAIRNDNVVVITINNSLYGMTGGQMAPTTLIGMKTATCPYGRDAALHGYPLKMADIAAGLEGTCFVTRQSVHNVPSILKAKKAIRKAFDYSMQGRGSSLVEIVAACSTNWKMTPEKANKWMEENMIPVYPLGDLKDNG